MRPDLPPNVENSRFLPHRVTEDGFRYFAPKGVAPSMQPAKLQVLVVSSVRDSGLSEFHGRNIEVKDGRRFMKGSIHHLLDLSQEELTNKVSVCGVVIDDVPASNGVEERGYSILPSRDSSAQWLMPSNYQLSDGTTLFDLVEHLPSSFRKLRAKTSDEILAKAQAKVEFEERLGEIAKARGANVILSDNLLIILKTLHNRPEFQGRVINIHPGITWEGDPDACRGDSPTGAAMAKAALRPGEKFFHGASIHFISNEIDAGDVLCDAKRTEVRDEDRLTLRYRNYQESKLPLMRHGFQYLYEHFDSLSKAYKDSQKT